MKYTTDPVAAIQSLLSSEEPSPIISFDGVTYRISDASDQKAGFFQILTKGHVSNYVSNYRLAMGLELQTGDADEPLTAVSKWLASGSEGWFRSARLDASFYDAS
jgi:hypothetical protein